MLKQAFRQKLINYVDQFFIDKDQRRSFFSFLLVMSAVVVGFACLLGIRTIEDKPHRELAYCLLYLLPTIVLGIVNFLKYKRKIIPLWRLLIPVVLLVLIIGNYVLQLL
ncbi:MAG: hypothetical protein K0S09_1181 [Sphingobacteriaceae bacterium]|jgi:hypothetical protein|nr:hypothetical protein [Sphingobacteriaceae bacterium]